MYLYGASGHGKVIRDILNAQGVRVDAFVDDNPQLSQVDETPVRHQSEGLSPMIVSIGVNEIRKRVAERLDCRFGVAIHPSAVVSPSAEIGEGTVVMPGAIINAGAVIGRHCIINSGAVVEHDCQIADFVHISPQATLCGGITVGEGSWIGAGATIIQGVKIGRWSIIGAGSVVTKDIPDGYVAYGTPCHRVRRINEDLL